MRVQNQVNFNTSIYAKHTGQGTPEYITVPAGSTLELEDAVWTEKFAKAAAPQLENGNLKITKSVALTAEAEAEAQAKQLAAAVKLIADHNAKVAADKKAPKA